MTKPNSTEIVFVVDYSGSMASIAGAMNLGFDDFIKKQKAVAGECKVTAVAFNWHYEELYTAVPLASVPPCHIQPQGGTALLDAVARAIASTGDRLSRMAESDRPSQVLFVIITDGYENSSTEFRGESGRKRVAEMITHQRSKYAWEFVFLGANQDAIEVGTGLGVSAQNSVNYAADHEGTRCAMDSLSSSVVDYRERGESSMPDMFGKDRK